MIKKHSPTHSFSWHDWRDLKNLEPELQELVRRALPSMIKYDICTDMHTYNNFAGGAGASTGGTGGAGGTGGVGNSGPATLSYQSVIDRGYEEREEILKRVQNDRRPTKLELPTSRQGTAAEGPGVATPRDDGGSHQTFEEQMAKYALTGFDTPSKYL